MDETRLTYRSVEGNSQAEFRDRGSKFLSYIYPLNKSDDAKAIIKSLKAEHPKAVHFCYAYRLGTDGLQFRANDDGEPSGSAGKPILGQIDSADVTNVLAVVVRYFGGTLLGVPGLINAYKTVTAEGLAQASIIEKPIEFLISLEYDYSIMNEVLQVLKQNNATIYKQEMQLFCVLEAGIPLSNREPCMERLKNIYGLEIVSK